MKKANKSYTEEFKRQIVELRKSGRKMSDITKEYGITKTTVYNWENQYAISGKFGVAENMSETEKENRALKKEVKHLRMENDILKQAALILGRKDV